jgi:predicted dehydrogenase
MITSVAIVGLGGISLEHFRKLDRIEGVAVRGVCDLSPTLVEAVAERFNAGAGFTDYGQMLEAVRPDAVHVLTPPHSHPQLVREAIEAGAHVLVEKPAAPSFADYQEMRDLALERGRLLVENLNYRFMDVVTEALELVRQGAIGELVNLDVTLSVGIAQPDGPYRDLDLPHFAHDLRGGALRNFASHPASFVAAFAGDFEEVTVVRRNLSRGPGADELRALVAGERVTSAVTMTSHAKPAGMWLRLGGASGAIEVDVHGRRLHAERDGGPLSRLGAEVRHGVGHMRGAAELLGRVATARHDYFEGLDRLLRGFYASVREGAPSPLPLREMDVTNRLVDALLDGTDEQ